MTQVKERLKFHVRNLKAHGMRQQLTHNKTFNPAESSRKQLSASKAALNYRKGGYKSNNLIDFQKLVNRFFYK